MTGLPVVLLVGAVLGLVLGLLGGGGGILAVPMLVAIGQPVLVASTMSLVIVGVGAAAALVPHHRARRVDWRIGLTFGALGSVGAVAGAWAAHRTNPAIILAVLVVLLLVGAAVTLRAARSAYRRRMPALSLDGPADAEVGVIENRVNPSWGRTVVLATAVGFLTGFAGVGAGFVVVPALVAAMHVPMRRASATALVVIVMNSAVALIARQSSMGPVALTLSLAAATAAFGLVGAAISGRIPAWVLSAAFGTLMVLVAVYTAVQAVSAI